MTGRVLLVGTLPLETVVVVAIVVKGGFGLGGMARVTAGFTGRTTSFFFSSMGS